MEIMEEEEVGAEEQDSKALTKVDDAQNGASGSSAAESHHMAQLDSSFLDRSSQQRTPQPLAYQSLEVSGVESGDVSRDESDELQRPGDRARPLD